MVRDVIGAMCRPHYTHSKLETNVLVDLGIDLMCCNRQPRNSEKRVRVEQTGEAFYPVLL